MRLLQDRSAPEMLPISKTRNTYCPTARLSLNANTSLTFGDTTLQNGRLKPFPDPRSGELNELFVHPYVRGVAHSEGFFELDKGRAALQEPYGEGVA